jgi:hypothetical protein
MAGGSGFAEHWLLMDHARGKLSHSAILKDETSSHQHCKTLSLANGNQSSLR